MNTLFEISVPKWNIHKKIVRYPKFMQIVFRQGFSQFLLGGMLLAKYNIRYPLPFMALQVSDGQTFAELFLYIRLALSTDLLIYIPSL